MITATLRKHDMNTSLFKNKFLKNNFTFVLFDSLNRYYVANEHLEELSENWDKAVRCYSLANEIYPEYKIENVYKHEVDY